MQVHYDEGVAIRIGLEPCVGIREGAGEASAGEHTGQPLSRESNKVPGADGVVIPEGNVGWRVIASARPTRRGRRPGMCGGSLYGNREVSGLARGWTPRVRIGKARSRNR